MVMCFDYNKDFNCKIHVVQKDFKHKNKFDGFHKITLENVEFNNRFEVYTEDEETAFYLLTPSIIEKIIGLDIKNDGKLIFVFSNGKLYCFLHNYNYELNVPSLFEKINVDDCLNKFISDCGLISQFIDIFNLDVNVFENNNN